MTSTTEWTRITDPVRLGVDISTHKPVTIQAGDRILISGNDDSGKTTLLYTLAKRICVQGDQISFLDGSGGGLEEWPWSPDVSVSSCKESIFDEIDNLHAEMQGRKLYMKDRRLQVWDGPLCVTAVDEGVDLLLHLTTSKEHLHRLIEISLMGRVYGMPVWWTTFNPITTGPTPGLEPHINASLNTRVALRTNRIRAVLDTLGDDSEVPLSDIRQINPGQGFLSNYPNLIQMDKEGPH